MGLSFSAGSAVAVHSRDASAASSGDGQPTQQPVEVVVSAEVPAEATASAAAPVPEPVAQVEDASPSTVPGVGSGRASTPLGTGAAR